MKYIVGNWKSHKTQAQLQGWVATVKAAQLQWQTPELQVVLCPSFLHLPVLRELMPELTLGAQSLSPFALGAYTGAVAAEMAAEYAQFALLGHVERRKYFHETDQDIVQQTLRALEQHMTPILAVDDSNWSTLLSQFDDAQLKQMIVMYEPASAISTSDHGEAADLPAVKAALQLIKADYPIKAGLYGGSVNSQNILLYMQEVEIDGVVPGAASLDAEEFVKMIASIH